VIHRRTEYGPFDYEWSCDLRSIEMIYQGIKFGEVCTVHEFYADMKEFRLPRSVVKVACIVFGATLLGISNGFSADERSDMLTDALRAFDCGHFAHVEERR